MSFLQNDTVTECHCQSMTMSQNVIFTDWHCHRMSHLQNDTVTECHFYRM